MLLSKLESKKIYTSVLVVVLVFQILVLALPLFLVGPFAMGYDTGFYRRFLLNHNSNILSNAVPGLDHTVIVPRIWLAVINGVGIPANIVLFGSYIFLVVACTYLYYVLVSGIFDKKVALISSFIISSSAVVYHAYWYMFYKNFFGLALLFLLFHLINTDKYPFLRILLSIFIILSHQTTTFFLFAVLALYIALEFVFKKRVRLVELLSLTISILVYFYFHPNIQGKIEAPPVGIFLTHIKFLLLSAGVLIGSFFGIKKFYYSCKNHLIILSCSIVAILFPLLSLPYYQRIYLYTFYVLALVSAIGFEYIFVSIKESASKFKAFWVAIIVLCAICQTSALVFIIKNDKPLVTVSEAQSLDALAASLPNGASVVTSSRLVPWVQGWSRGKVFGPGLLKDKNSPEDWYAYWAGDDRQKISFLSQFPKPIYVYIGDEQKGGFVPDKCSDKINNMLYSMDGCF